MADQNKRRQQIVADACRTFKDLPSLTLAKKLHAQYPRLFSSVEIARSNLRYYRGNCGERDRKKAASKELFRPSGSQSDRPPLPKSLARPWEPFVLEGAKRVEVISDIHLPYHDEVALEAALDYGDGYNPDVTLINGDLLDWEGISRFDPRGPTLSAKHQLRMGREFFAHLRSRRKGRIIFKLGNHDERWSDYLWRKAEALAEVCQDVWQWKLRVKKYGVEVVGDQRPIMCGHLPILHGHELQKGIAAPVNPARGAFLKAHHTLLVGHSHQTSGHGDTNLFHKETFCWSTGCLCDLTPRYARVNRWNHGAATVTIASDGSFDVENLRIKDGKIRKS